MTTKNLIVLAVAAAALGGAAWWLNGGGKASAPKLNGRAVAPDLRVADVAEIDVGGTLKLVAGEKGWTIASLYGYPADREKIAENLLKLGELKVGQVVRGKKLDKVSPLVLKDAAGRELLNLPLGERHAKWGHGRYATFAGETVLVSDALDAFDGDAKKWCSTRIASVPSSDVKTVKFACGAESFAFARGTNSTWTLIGLKADEELDASKTYALDSALAYLDFSAIADPKLSEIELGFATGHVYAVTYAEGTNAVTRTATVGNAVKGGTDRYFKLDGSKWIYTIPNYAAEGMMKTRKDFVKTKDKAAK